MFLFLICILSEAHGSQRAEPSAKSQLTTKAWIECYKTESAGYDILLLSRKTWLPYGFRLSNLVSRNTELISLI